MKPVFKGPHQEGNDSKKFKLDMYEAMDKLHHGKKIQNEEWSDDEWIFYDENTQEITDENGDEIAANVFLFNRHGNWRVVK